MSSFKSLFSSELKVINVGLDSFSASLKDCGVSVTDINWSPQVFSGSKTLELLDTITNSVLYSKTTESNRIAGEKILSARPVIRGIGNAHDDIPGMERDLFLHAGPPIEWERMSGPLKGGIIGGILYEGMANSVEDAIRLAESGKIRFEPCHHHSSVGPMAGIITPSMPVWIIENQTSGNKSYATLNEGLGKVLRYGAYSEEVIDRLRWMQNVLAPILKQIISIHGDIDLKSLISQALQMGDEGHNRNRAGTSLLIREIVHHIVSINAPDKDKIDVLNFINSNDHFILNLTMPASKCIMDSVMGIEYSSIVGIMARNGTDFGIKLSCMPDQWFTGEAQEVEGLYFPQFSSNDANPDIGDSVITETAGIGGFAMAAAPAIVKFVGGEPDDAIKFTQDMYNITTTESTAYQIPALGFRGTPTGIDLLKVIDTGILPVINTGIAHKEPGIGMIGAGLVRPPSKCFNDAMIAYYNKYKNLL